MHDENKEKMKEKKTEAMVYTVMFTVMGWRSSRNSHSLENVKMINYCWGVMDGKQNQYKRTSKP